eukprot:g5092.t1
MFREYFPNRPDYTLEQNQTYRARINQRVVNTMKSMVENEGANNLKLLNANEMIDVSSNVERTNAYLQVLARKKLDIKQIANEELIKMNNELMGSHRTILHSMHMQQRQMELINAKEKKENRRFALMFRNKFEDRKRFQMASKSPEERRRQTKIQEYLDNMLKNHEDETFSSQLLNTKRQELKKWREELKTSKPLSFGGYRPNKLRVNLRHHVNIRQYAEDRHRENGGDEFIQEYFSAKKSPIKQFYDNPERPSTTQSSIKRIFPSKGSNNIYDRPQT